MRSGIWSFFLLVALAAGCSRGTTEGKVLARVGDRRITVADFEDAYRRVALQDTSIHPGSEGRRKVLDSLIDKTLLESAAREKYPYLNESQKERLRVFREDELKKAMDAREVTSKIQVGEDEVRKLYDARGTRYRVRHIFLPNRDEAQAALNMLQQGAAFTAVAAAQSRDRQTASAGGEMDWFLPGWGPGAEFEQATMALAAGQSSGIVQSGKGYEIIRLEEKAPAQERGSFENEQRQLELILKARVAERLTHALRDRLFEKYALEVPPDVPGAIAAWMASGGERGQLPGIQFVPDSSGQMQRRFNYTAQDSARVIARLRPLDISKLLQAGAMGDSVWVRQRAEAGISLPEYARWLSDQPVDLWPNTSEPWTVERSIRELAFREVEIREALAVKLYEEPELASRFADRESRTRVMRYYFFQVQSQVTPSPEDVRRVFEDGQDRYRYPERLVVRAMSSGDSSVAVSFAAALRSGESFRVAAARAPVDRVRITGPDTLVAANSAEAEPALSVLTAPGQVSGPFRWSQGIFTVFQLVELLPVRALTFEEAEQYARRDAVSLAEDARLKNLLADLRKRYKVVADESLLEKIPDPPLQRAATEVAS